MQAERAVFRALLRVARKHDRQPEHLTTLLGWPSLVFDRQTHSAVRQAVVKCPLAEDAIWEACGGSLEFSHPSGRAASAVRRHRRRLEALGLEYLPGARMLLDRFQRALSSADRVIAAAANKERTKLPRLELEFVSGPRAGQRLVLGEHAVERVEGRLVLAESSENEASPDAGSRLAGFSSSFPPVLDEPAPLPPVGLPPLGGPPVAPASASSCALRRVAADDITPCSVGQLLIAHPLSAIAKPFVDRAVVLLTGLDDDAGGYVKGVALNVPARGTLRSVLAAWSCRSGDGGLTQIGAEDRSLMETLEPLLDAPLLSGGDTMARTLSESITWLHTLGPVVPGATEVAPATWLGGDLAVIAGLVASGQATLERLRPILGFSCWLQSQLELDLRRGAWVRARMASAEISRQLCMSAPPYDDSSAREKHRADLWRAALRAAGLPGLADFPRGRGVDEIIQVILREHYRDMRCTDHERV